MRQEANQVRIKIEPYLDEIQYQCSRAMRCMETYHELIKEPKKLVGVFADPDPVYERDVVEAIHHFCIHSAMASKIIWSSKAGFASRRSEQIRKVLRINEQHPLQSRPLRNAIEHFDERLDKYLEDNTTGDLRIDFCLCDSLSALDGTPKEAMFRVLNYKDHIYVFMGKEYCLRNLEHGTRDLISRVASVLSRKGGSIATGSSKNDI